MARTLPHEHYRTLFESLDQGFCTIEVLFDQNGVPTDYRFLDVNPAFTEQTGLRDAVGRRMRELAPGHEEHWFKVYGQVALTGEPVRFEHEAAALGRWFDVFAVRVGEPERRQVAVLFRDITARKEAERRLLASDQALRRSEAAHRAARVDAEQASRMKDEFLAMLGHELRNPLAPMLTALQLMRLRGRVSREQEVLERQMAHLMRMVDDLLDVSRITSGKVELKRQPVELCDVVVRAMETAGPLLEQRQDRVDVRIPRRGLGILVDLDRMAQVLSNLLTNAAKYSEPGSRIVLSGRRDGDTVRISVKDEGIGIVPDMLDSVFEAFVQQPQTLDRSRGGLGLGLAIVRSLVAAHGGTVRAESEGINCGSELIVELPAVNVVPAGMAVTTSRAADCQAEEPKKRILVVDDNRDAADMLRVALEQRGHVVDVAFDGPSALAHANTFAPDVALLDLGLPVMDGYEVARRLHEMEGADRLRLIAVSGYGQEADRRQSIEAGFERHLVKPIDLDDLERVIENTGRQ